MSLTTEPREQRRIQMVTSKLVTSGGEPRVPLLRCCPTSNRNMAMSRPTRESPVDNLSSYQRLPATRLNIELPISLPPHPLSPALITRHHRCYFNPNRFATGHVVLQFSSSFFSFFLFVTHLLKRIEETCSRRSRI